MVKALKTAPLRLPPRIGAWCWQRKANQPRLKAALEKLCRTYWWPLYGFVRREGYKPEEAQDLTQAFFARLLERKDLETVRQERGRLRSYLLASIKNFLSKARHREMTVKRGEGRPLVSLEDLLARERADQEPAHKLSADRIYERRWALTLLEQVLARLRAEYEAAGKLPLFDRLKELLARESGQPSQAKIAAEMQMTENAVKQAFHRLRHRYRQLLHEEIAHTVAVPDDVEDELRHFIVRIANVTCERISGSTEGDDKSAGKQDDKCQQSLRRMRGHRVRGRAAGSLQRVPVADWSCLTRQRK